MGQKVNPIGFRLGINRTWDSRWFARKDEYGRLLHQDIAIRKELKKRLYQAGVSRIIIERPHKKCRITIYAARPGVIIGKKGADIEKLRKQLGAMTSSDVSLNIVEIRKPEIDSKLVAQGVADQLERRIAFRRAMKRAVQSALRLGAEGIRITCSGRSAAPRSRDGMVPRRPRAAAHAARRHRLRLRRSQDHLRHHRRQGVDLQRRGARARPDGAGQALGRRVGPRG